MKLNAEIDGTHRTIETRREGERVVAKIDERSFDLVVREPEPGVFLLIHDGIVYECGVSFDAASRGACEVRLGAHLFHVALSDPKRLRSAESSGADTNGRASVVAAMPGKVVRVLVEQGASVEAGDGLVIVEAMKMQNELKSPKAGTVVELHAEAGATVNAGEVLAVVE